jgi:hypothetical protein
LFSSSNTHVHFDQPNKCIYCGSKSIGGGCLYNPNGSNHIKAPDFLLSVKEQVKKSSILSYLYENLSNVECNQHLTPLNRFYKRLSGIIHSAGQTLLETFSLQSKPNLSDLSKQDFLKVIDYKEKLSHQLKGLNETLKYANLDLPQEIVEDILVDAIISIDDEKT